MRIKLRKAAVGLCLLASVVMLDGAIVSSSSTGAFDLQTRYVAQAFDEARFKAELATVLKSDEMVTDALRNFDLPPSHYDVYRDHMTRLWSNDEVVSAFVDEVTAILPALNLESATQAREFGMTYSAAWFQEKAMKGLLRLDSDKIRIHRQPKACSRTARQSSAAPLCLTS